MHEHILSLQKQSHYIKKSMRFVTVHLLTETSKQEQHTETYTVDRPRYVVHCTTIATILNSMM